MPNTAGGAVAAAQGVLVASNKHNDESTATGRHARASVKFLPLARQKCKAGLVLPVHPQAAASLLYLRAQLLVCGASDLLAAR